MESAREILARMGLRISTSGDASDTSSGTEPDDSASGPACAICNDVGYVRLDVPLDHPDFGRAVPCRCRKQALVQQRIDRLAAHSNLGALRRHTFATLIDGGRSGIPDKQERFRRACLAARAYAEKPDGWLVFMGISGCGKTHLAAAIANARIDQGEPAFFAIVPDLLDYLRQTYQPESPVSYDELFEEVRNTPLLILDDLGTQHNTPWAKEKLFQILNHRFNARLPTVLTTNCALDELDDRIRSRLTDTALCQVVVVEGRESDILQRLGRLDQLGRMTFETFDPHQDGLTADEVANLLELDRVVREFANVPDGWLILQGKTGCGKTHMAAAIAQEVQRRGEPVLFVVVPDLLDYLRSTYQPDSRVSYDEVFESLRTCKLLVLDDLGAHASTPWAREKLYQIVNHRYVARLATVVTTNCSLEELEPRIASRMADPRLGVNFWIKAPDYRTVGRPHGPGPRSSSGPSRPPSPRRPTAGGR
ncbi:MAG: ATP-binding protein [Chloroflexi bacterium]|nr:ATP-binding protein [Chloroflexota bacterium]